MYPSRLATCKSESHRRARKPHEVSIANRSGLAQKTQAVEYSKPKWKSIVTKSDKVMTPNPTKEEIDALEREIQKQQKQRNRRVRRAVNPERGFGC